MKKIFVGMLVMIAIISCKQKGQSGQNIDSAKTNNLKAKTDTPKTGITLNGYTEDQADTMIAKFKGDSDNYTSNAKANIWFSKQYVHDIRLMIDKAGDDGIRVYFAKNADGTYNFIIVATKDDGPSPYPQYKSLHQDYYGHTDAFLSTNEAKGILDYGTDPGALLYGNAQCPVNINCHIDPLHDITCADAKRWVQSFSNTKFNSSAEWYDRFMIDAIDGELQNQNNGADGVRIYYAIEDIDKPNRNCFVFITTKTDKYPRQDYFECLAPDSMAGDKGELCPNSCTP